MSSTPPARPPAPRLLDRRIVRLSRGAVLCVVAAVLAAVIHRSLLGLVLALIGIGLAVSARRRAGKHRRWVGANLSLLAVIGGLIVVLDSLPLLIGGIAGLWNLG